MRSVVLLARLEASIAMIAAILFVWTPTTASALEPVTLPQGEDAVAFEVITLSQDIPIMVRDLEALGLYRVTTASPWEKGELTFEGVLFSDVVEHLGLADASGVRMRALDGYTQIIPRQDWIDKPLLLATRQNGKQLTRRTQGPTRLIYPLSEYPAYDATVHDARWIWLIESIERID